MSFKLPTVDIVVRRIDRKSNDIAAFIFATIDEFNW